VIKATRVRWTGNVTYTNEIINAHTIIALENPRVIGQLEDIEVDGKKILTGSWRNKV
jgi:hypothetical protein